MDREQRKKIAEGMRYDDWYEWERMFAVIPKRDLHGKLIFGKIWKRERYGSVQGKYDPRTNTTPIYSAIDAMYATNKEVFKQRLKEAGA